MTPEPSQSQPSTALVVTTINRPNAILSELAKGCLEHDWRFVVVGDKKGPDQFDLAGASFYSLDDQLDLSYAYAAACPTGHYARKNIGYLLAIAGGAEIIVETDDDNMPRDGFWEPRSLRRTAADLSQTGWVNIYRYFSDSLIWPRGLPLDAVHAPLPDLPDEATAIDSPIQQGLADENPDVDAIFRLLLPLPQNFSQREPIALGEGVWCPFNSQNTSWWRQSFPLLYLPAYCSFRMTDIWRSFVAQRVAWACGWSVLFHAPTVYQERNEHNLMRDFEDEVPGYVNNRAIGELLDSLTLKPGIDSIAENMVTCYEAMVAANYFPAKELALLQHWLDDLDAVTAR